MEPLSLFELLALKQLENGSKSSIQIIRAVDEALEINLGQGAKYAAVRKLVEEGLSEWVDNADISGKVSAITAEGREVLYNITLALIRRTKTTAPSFVSVGNLQGICEEYGEDLELDDSPAYSPTNLESWRLTYASGMAEKPLTASFPNPKEALDALATCVLAPSPDSDRLYCALGSLVEIEKTGFFEAPNWKLVREDAQPPVEQWVLTYFLDGVRRVIHRPTAKACLDCLEDLEPFAIAKGAFVKSYPLACRQISEIEKTGQFVADDWVLEKQ